MTEAPAAARSRNGTPAREPARTSDAGKRGLARTLVEKRQQGFTIESETDNRAVVAMKGRRKWFGLANSPSVRYEVTVDEGGRATSRRL